MCFLFQIMAYCYIGASALLIGLWVYLTVGSFKDG